ncbi:MAG: hypothetical protein ACXWAT_12985 [Methylobacter sp.]
MSTKHYKQNQAWDNPQNQTNHDGNDLTCRIVAAYTTSAYPGCTIIIKPREHHAGKFISNLCLRRCHEYARAGIAKTCFCRTQIIR